MRDKQAGRGLRTAALPVLSKCICSEFLVLADRLTGTIGLVALIPLLGAGADSLCGLRPWAVS